MQPINSVRLQKGTVFVPFFVSFINFDKNPVLIVENKIAKPLDGPSKFIGITFLTLGLVLILNGEWFFGIPFLVLTEFLFFSTKGVDVDTQKRVFRPYNNVFGIWKRGRWMTVDRFVGLTIVPVKQVRTTYSRSDRRNSIIGLDYVIYLVNKAKKPDTVLKKCRSEEEARNSVDEFSIWLRLPVYGVKRKSLIRKS